VVANNGRYRAECSTSPCRHNYLGTFGTPEEAAQAYLQHQEKEHLEELGKQRVPRPVLLRVPRPVLLHLAHRRQLLEDAVRALVLPLNTDSGAFASTHFHGTPACNFQSIQASSTLLAQREGNRGKKVKAVFMATHLVGALMHVLTHHGKLVVQSNHIIGVYRINNDYQQAHGRKCSGCSQSKHDVEVDSSQLMRIDCSELYSMDAGDLARPWVF